MQEGREDRAWRTGWRTAVDAHFTQVDRLRTLGVRVLELSPVGSCTHLERFLREYVAPEHASVARAALDAGGAFPVERWLPPDCIRPTKRENVSWLATGDEQASAHRLALRGDVPAVVVLLSTLEEAWATTWPGIFVRFELGRAVIVTPDYTVIRCELSMRGATPYR
jgi:hypothetical protein